jgi:hypothetical protein
MSPDAKTPTMAAGAVDYAWIFTELIRPESEFWQYGRCRSTPFFGGFAARVAANTLRGIFSGTRAPPAVPRNSHAATASLMRPRHPARFPESREEHSVVSGVFASRLLQKGW